MSTSPKKWEPQEVLDDIAQEKERVLAEISWEYFKRTGKRISSVEFVLDYDEEPTDFVVQAKPSSVEKQIDYLRKLLKIHREGYEKDLKHLQYLLDQERAWTNWLLKRMQMPFKTLFKIWLWDKFGKDYFEDGRIETRNKVSKKQSEAVSAAAQEDRESSDPAARDSRRP